MYCTCVLQVALDDGPGPPIKYQYPELGKLYQVRCTGIHKTMEYKDDFKTQVIILINPLNEIRIRHFTLEVG